MHREGNLDDIFLPRPRIGPFEMDFPSKEGWCIINEIPANDGPTVARNEP
jgi:hypothetical protein